MFSTTLSKGIGAIIALIAIGAVVFIYNRDGSGKPDNNATSTDIMIDGGAIGLPGGGTIELVPIENDAPPVPNLNRKIVFSSGLAVEAEQIMTDKINALVALLKKDSSSPENWLKLGVNRNIIGDNVGAAEAWEYVKYLSPKDITAYVNLGDLYHFYLKNYPASEKNFLLALSLKKDNIAIYRALYDLYTLSYTAKAGEAPNILEQGIKANPGSYDLMIILGSYWKEKDDKNKALQSFNQALSAAEKAGDNAKVELIRAEIESLK